MELNVCSRPFKCWKSRATLGLAVPAATLFDSLNSQTGRRISLAIRATFIRFPGEGRGLATRGSQLGPGFRRGGVFEGEFRAKLLRCAQLS